MKEGGAVGMFCGGSGCFYAALLLLLPLLFSPSPACSCAWASRSPATPAACCSWPRPQLSLWLPPMGPGPRSKWSGARLTSWASQPCEQFWGGHHHGQLS